MLRGFSCQCGTIIAYIGVQTQITNDMENHITNTELEDLMEKFLHENPYGDSLDLARFMYNHGYEQAGKDSINQ